MPCEAKTASLEEGLSKLPALVYSVAFEQGLGSQSFCFKPVLKHGSRIALFTINSVPKTTGKHLPWDLSSLRCIVSH